MKKPIVSVVMPVYNGGRFLSTAIKSILSQTLRDYEFIIIDDASTDGSGEIISSFIGDPRLVIVRHKINKGFADSVNEGKKLAKGKYVARMDCDDISMAFRLERQVKYMDSHPEIDICGSWAIAINEDDGKLFEMRSLTGNLLKYNYWKPSPFIHPTVFMKKKVAKNCSFDKNFCPAEDYEMWLRLSKKFTFANIPEFLLEYRITQTGMSKSNPEKPMIMSRRAFEEVVGMKCRDMKEYSSLVCKSFDLWWWNRLLLLIRLSKRIKYPVWMIMLDNFYYLLRRITFWVNPRLRKY